MRAQLGGVLTLNTRTDMYQFSKGGETSEQCPDSHHEKFGIDRNFDHFKVDAKVPGKQGPK